MKILTKAFQTLLIAPLAFLLTYFSLRFAWFIIEGFKALSPEVYIPLFATLSTAALGIYAALKTQSKIRQREVENSHRDKKVEMYFRFLTLIQKVLQDSNERVDLGTEKLSDNQLMRELIDFQTEFTLWASPMVLNAFENLKISGNRGRDEKSNEVLFSIDPLYRAIREDIGLSNFGLEKNHFLRSILSDPEEVEQLRQ